jgi:CelD/BcsL family acetyltransferase involved in cellulose biosynthesis
MVAGGSAAVLACVDGGDLAALAPLARVAIAGSPGLALVPMATGSADYVDMVLPADGTARTAALTSLLAALSAARMTWDVWDLAGVPTESPTTTELPRRARELGLEVHVATAHARPFVELTGSFDEYLRGRPGRFRYNLRSRLARLEKLGRVELRVIRDAASVAGALGRLRQLHARRWAGQYTSTTFSSSATAFGFYVAACEQYANRGMLDLTLLEVEGRAVAASLGFVDRGCYYYYLPAWDPEFSVYAPASILVARLIERAFEMRLERFDFMIGDEEYKDRWATDRSSTSRLIIGRGARGRAAAASLIQLHELRQRARQSARLRSWRRNVLGRARAVADRLAKGRGADVD